MIDKFFHILYDTIIVTVIKTTQELQLYIEILHKKTLKDSIEKTFTLNDSFSQKVLYEYIKKFSEQTPYLYITLLDTSYEQGALPTCDKQKFEPFKDLSTAQYNCYNQQWLYYTSKPELQDQIDFLGQVGVDFVYSPFVLLSKFFHDKITARHDAMFVLILEESLSIAVFKESQLLFGHYIDISAHVASSSLSEMLEENNEEMEEMEESVDLDSVDLDNIDIDDNDLGLDDDLDELDDFDTIEDLDSLESLDSLDEGDDLEQKLDENLEELDSEQARSQQQETDDDDDKLSNDYERFLLIQQALKNYYSNEKYNSNFVENIYIADSVKLSSDFKRYLQDELFLNVFIRSVEIEFELTAITKEELGLL